MHIKLSIDNRFISLCNVDVKFDENGKTRLMEAWKTVERFIDNSNFAGVQNLIVSFEIDGTSIFDKTKVRLKKVIIKMCLVFLRNSFKIRFIFSSNLKKRKKLIFYVVSMTAISDR